MKPAYERLILIIFISLVLTLVGCRTKDDDGESPTPGGAATATEPTAAATGLTFNISGATALIAQEDTMTEASASSSAFASGGGEVKRYRIVNQRQEREALREAKATGDLPNFASTENDPSSGTNLFAVDENGNSQLALSADNAIKVMYSVVDPNGEYVYLALDAGWNEDDGNDYTQHIALANCAFYKVKIADDSYSCVMEGATVQPMDDSYAMTVSGNQKPVQFDSQGNLFFAATTFEREEYATGEVVSYSVSATQWDPQIYKMDQETGEISTVTQDNVTVDFFMVLTTGELVYQSTNIETEQSKLYLYQGSSTIDLTGAGWGVDFFARDDTNAVLWGSFTQTGIRFARPRSEGGVYKATMDTNLFGGAGGGDSSYNSRPVRILVGDNGRIYGVFQSWVMQNQGTRPQNPMDDSVDAGTTDSNLSVSFLPKLTVYQILPFDGTPKLELTMPEDGDWWTWMGNTPFQVANGYLFYKELYDSADYYGT
ncbi:MAG: hypothetical protein GY866_19355, partial [Proteobacteria bacterium]|nr:hypothetical protein [Pseudomonadota bacterium]